tara:strand:- start:382 stop:948 length:567 start_codon:yes stop_codon:yes gene_type:complete
MAVTTGGNFNFQGIGVVVNTDVVQPPPITFPSPMVIVSIDDLLLNTNDPIFIYIRNRDPLTGNTLITSEEPTRFDASIQLPVLEIDGPTDITEQHTDVSYSSLQFDSADLVLFDQPTGHTYTDGEVIANFTFYWEDSSGNVIYQNDVETAIEVMLGCTDPNANNYDDGVNMNDGSCTFTPGGGPGNQA